MFFPPIHLVVRVSAESKEYKAFGFLIIPRWKSATSWPIGGYYNIFIKRVKYHPTGKIYSYLEEVLKSITGNIDLNFSMYFYLFIF